MHIPIVSFTYIYIYTKKKVIDWESASLINFFCKHWVENCKRDQIRSKVRQKKKNANNVGLGVKLSFLESFMLNFSKAHHISEVPQLQFLLSMQRCPCIIDLLYDFLKLLEYPMHFRKYAPPSN